jgi:hypothetical protein
MGLISYFNKRLKKLSLFDVGLTKWAAVFFGLLLAKLIPQIMDINIWWFVVLCMLFSIKPFYVFYIKK